MTRKSKKKQSESFITFLNKIQIPLIALFLLLVIAVILFFVLMEVNRTRSERAITRAYVAETELAQLDPEADLHNEEMPDGDTEAEDSAENKSEGRNREDLITELTSIANEYPRQYGGIRSRYLLAQLAWEDENYTDALAYFDQVIRNAHSSHLVENAYLGAAASLEALERPEDALEYYQRALKNVDTLLTKSRIEFSIGRLHDTLGDTEAAYKQFEQLFTSDSSSVYGKLAKTRMIALEDKISSDADTAE